MVKFQAPEGSMNRGISMFVVLAGRSWERRHVGGEAPERWNPGRLPALKKKHRRHLKQQPEAPWGLFPLPTKVDFSGKKARQCSGGEINTQCEKCTTRGVAVTRCASHAQKSAQETKNKNCWDVTELRCATTVL